MIHVSNGTGFLLASVFGFGGTAVAIASRYLPRPRRTPAPAPAGLVVTGWRYCPQEMRTRAAIEHRDGSATCSGCGALIPAGDS